MNSIIPSRSARSNWSRLRAFCSLALVLLLAPGLPRLGWAQSLVTYPVNSIANGDNTSTMLAPIGISPNIIASPITLHF